MKAPCPHYAHCSGCTLQHFPYVKQLHDKDKQLQLSFAALNRNNQALQKIEPSPQDFGYRTSSKLCLHEDELGRRSIGLYQRASKRVLHIPDCPVHHPEINKLLGRLFPFGARLPAPFYQHNKKSFQPGRMKFLTVRYAPDTRSFGLVLSHTGIPRDALETWAAQLRLPHLCLFESELKQSDADLVISREVKHLAGSKTFAFKAGELSFQLSPLAFFQANSILAPRFIEHIIKDLKGQTLLDLYGGFGAYSFALRENFEKISLVEVNEYAIAAAQQQLENEPSKSKNISIHAAAVEDFLQGLLRQESKNKLTHIIANPPRSGLSSRACQLLRRSLWPSARELVYVSCNVETLRRDLHTLLEPGGWSVTSLTPFDMFPQTDHVEMVAKLRPQIK